MKNKIIVLFTSLIFSANAFASQALTQKNVIDSALKNYPKVLSYYEKIAVKEGGVLENEGFFDIKLKQTYSDKTRGFYDGKILDSFLEKQNAFLGSKVYAGYRKSFGSFPSYEAGSITNSDGEYRAGIKFSLLQNSMIDQGRLDLITSKLQLKESKVQLENIKIEIQRDASKAYWSWVVAGKIFQTYKNLYEIALKRNQQLEARLEKGDIAQIILAENNRNVLNRKSAMLEAQRKFENAAIYLSLFYRDENQNPKIPHEKNLPELEFKTQNIDFSQIEKDLIHALIERPEIKLIKIRKEQEMSNLEQANNLLKPQLDVDVGVSKDIGAGPISREQTNNYAQAQIQMPLQRREAKGKVAATESKIKVIKYEEQLLGDKIKSEIEQIRNSLNFTSTILENLEEEISLCKKVENAERERFKNGNSDFFLINLREQETAEAKINQLNTYEKYKDFTADYKAAAFIWE